MDDLIQQLRDFSRACPKDVFPSLSIEERLFVVTEMPGMMERISAGMGRHFSKFAIEAADALEKQQAEIERMKGHIKHIGNDALRTELQALKAQAAKDAADVGRLDWLESTHHNHVIQVGKTWYTRAKYGAPFTKRQSLREAIDFAMKESQS